MIQTFLSQTVDENNEKILKHFFDIDRLRDPFFVNSTLLLKGMQPYGNHDNCLILLHNDLTEATNGKENIQQYINILLTYTTQLTLRQLSMKTNIFGNAIEPHLRAIGLRCLIKNFFSADYNETGDQVIINECLSLIDELHNQSKTNKEFLLYNQ